MSLLGKYIQNGFALIPIPSGSKGPINKGWNYEGNVIVDASKLSLITENLGLAHAYCKPYPTGALDIDDCTKAFDWFSKRGVNLNELLNADDAVQIVSGRENRAKLLYRLPIILKTCQITDPVTKEMVLEFRCASANGKTVQDVLPPSIHPVSGTTYIWGGKGTWKKLPELPDKLLTIWNELTLFSSHSKNALNETTKALLNSPTPETPREIARLESMLEFIPANCSYDTYRNVVWAILHTGWDCAERLAHEWSMTEPDRFEELTFTELVKSYDDSKSPTLGTIYHLARTGGWNG
jgi:hypothetical protein